MAADCVRNFGTVQIKTNDEGTETLYAQQLGDSENDVEDLHVSNDSIWLGDDHKVQITSAGKFKFRRRIKNSVPPVISSGGGTSAGALTHSGMGSLGALSKRQWRRYARSLGGSLSSAKNKDIWRDNSADYSQESNDGLEAGQWLIASSDVYLPTGGKVGVGTDATILANTMLEIRDTSNASLLLHDSDATSTKRIVEFRSQGEEFFVQGRNDTNTGDGAAGTFISSSLTTGATQIHNSLGIGTAGSGTAGEIRATNEITAYYSDRRLKDVQGPILDALNKVDQLTGYRYKGNETAVKLGYTDDKQQVGLMAQDVQKVVPEAVTLAPIDINLDGSSKSGENYLTIKYEKLIPLLVNAIKELRQEVNDLKSKAENTPTVFDVTGSPGWSAI